jgi:TPR repeat protein
MKDPTALLNAKTNHKYPSSARVLGWVFAFLVYGVFHNALAETSRDAAIGALQRLDYDGAAAILRRLADDGDARAQAALSSLIESGQLSENSTVPAIELLRKAAEQGLGLAALELGNRFHLGTGVPQDQTRATKWWTVAAEKGTSRAAFNLGLTYSQSLYAPVNLDRAKKWFRVAADRGLKEAEFALGVLEFNDESFALAYGHFESAAESGLAIAQYNLATMLERGLGHPADIDEALRWYQLAATLKLEEAIESLTRLGVPASGQNEAVQIALLAVDWVLSQPGSNFTLQVAIDHSKQAAINILERYDASVERAYVSLRTPATQAQYIALVGSFTSYLEAISFLNSLDDKLRANKPWIRRFTTVHTQLSSLN